jgi:hypothetical protein
MPVSAFYGSFPELRMKNLPFWIRNTPNAFFPEFYKESGRCYHGVLFSGLDTDTVTPDWRLAGMLHGRPKSEFPGNILYTNKKRYD